MFQLVEKMDFGLYTEFEVHLYIPVNLDYAEWRLNNDGGPLSPLLFILEWELLNRNIS